MEAVTATASLTVLLNIASLLTVGSNSHFPVMVQAATRAGRAPNAGGKETPARTAFAPPRLIDDRRRSRDLDGGVDAHRRELGVAASF
jgi:hypothetical protein